MKYVSKTPASPAMQAKKERMSTIASTAHKYAQQVIDAGYTYFQKLRIGFKRAWEELKAVAATIVAVVSAVTIQLNNKPLREGMQSKKYWAAELINFGPANLNEYNFINNTRFVNKTGQHKYINKYLEVETGKVYLVEIDGARDYVINKSGAAEYVTQAEALAYAATFAPALAPAKVEISAERAEQIYLSRMYDKNNKNECAFYNNLRNVHSDSAELTKEELFIVANSAVNSFNAEVEIDGELIKLILHRFTYNTLNVDFISQFEDNGYNWIKPTEELEVMAKAKILAPFKPKYRF